MIERCKPDKQYGRLGIVVCERWRKFANFLADMGKRPDGCEIDRRDVTGIYEPSNCRWLPKRANRQQRRTTKLAPGKREQILQMKLDGMSQRAIAQTMDVSESCISDFLRGASWAQP
jgi:hypothetical protein